MAGDEDGEVKVWNFSSGACLCTLKPKTHEEVTAILGIRGSFMKHFLVAGWDRRVRALTGATPTCCVCACVYVHVCVLVCPHQTIPGGQLGPQGACSDRNDNCLHVCVPLWRWSSLHAHVPLSMLECAQHLNAWVVEVVHDFLGLLCQNASTGVGPPC